MPKTIRMNFLSHLIGRRPIKALMTLQYGFNRNVSVSKRWKMNPHHKSGDIQSKKLVCWIFEDEDALFSRPQTSQSEPGARVKFHFLRNELSWCFKGTTFANANKMNSCKQFSQKAKVSRMENFHVFVGVEVCSAGSAYRISLLSASSTKEGLF